MSAVSNHPAAGKAGIVARLAMGHHWPGLPEPGRSATWRPPMRALFLILALSLTGCASQPRLLHVTAGGFRSRWIERELDYYVASFSPHATNHFYVGVTETDHGELVEALVYWSEERTILWYSELDKDAFTDRAPGFHPEIMAWHHELKLDRDTVDTQEDAGSSTYLETHRQWVDWMEQCVTRGKQYVVTKAEAMTRAPYFEKAQALK